MNDGTVTMGGKKKKRRSVEISLRRYNTNEWTLFGKNESLRALMAGASASAREFFPSVNWPPAVGSCLLLTFILIYCLYEPWQATYPHIQHCHITHEEYNIRRRRRNGFLIIYRLDLTLSVTAAGASLLLVLSLPSFSHFQTSTRVGPVFNWNLGMACTFFYIPALYSIYVYSAQNVHYIVYQPLWMMMMMMKSGCAVWVPASHFFLGGKWNSVHILGCSKHKSVHTQKPFLEVAGWWWFAFLRSSILTARDCSVSSFVENEFGIENCPIPFSTFGGDLRERFRI